MIRRNEGVDVHSACPRTTHPNVDVANGSGRNPGKNVPDLVVRKRRMLRSTQDRDYGRGRLPTLLMPDQREI